MKKASLVRKVLLSGGLISWVSSVDYCKVPLGPTDDPHTTSFSFPCAWSTSVYLRGAWAHKVESWAVARSVLAGCRLKSAPTVVDRGGQNHAPPPRQHPHPFSLLINLGPNAGVDVFTSPVNDGSCSVPPGDNEGGARWVSRACSPLLSLPT